MSQRSPRRRGVLMLGLVVAALWQATLAIGADRLDGRYRNRASVGLQEQSRLVYFLYYLGLYPVVSTLEPTDYSEAGARRLLAEHGDTLLMEEGPLYSAIRIGDHARILLYLPGAILKGTPREPSVRLTHTVAFTLALMALWTSFWWIGRPVLGAITVALVGSNPFQLFETHANENVFSWSITTAVLVLALHLPLLAPRGPPRRRVWLVPVLTALLLGTVHHIRSEPIAIILSAGATYLFLPQSGLLRRLALVGVLALVFAGTSLAWETAFRHRVDETRSVVSAAGGHPHPAPTQIHHKFWMAVWEGMADFGSDHGYEWNDLAAHAYARRALRRDYGYDFPMWRRGYELWNSYLDAEKLYPRLPFEVPRYDDVLRDKVLHDVAADPFWYLGVIAWRGGRLLWETTPVRLAWPGGHIPVPMNGIAVLPLLALLLGCRCRLLAQLTAFTIPVSLPALLVYSGRGMCNYSSYHVFTAGVLAGILIEGGLWWRRRSLLRRN